MAVVGAITSVIGTGYSIVKGQQQKKAQQKQLAEQRRANQKAEETAKKQQETNRPKYLFHKKLFTSIYKKNI